MNFPHFSINKYLQKNHYHFHFPTFHLLLNPLWTGFWSLKRSPTTFQLPKPVASTYIIPLMSVDCLPLLETFFLLCTERFLLWCSPWAALPLWGFALHLGQFLIQIWSRFFCTAVSATLSTPHHFTLLTPHSSSSVTAHPTTAPSTRKSNQSLVLSRWLRDYCWPDWKGKKSSLIKEAGRGSWGGPWMMMKRIWLGKEERILCLWGWRGVVFKKWAKNWRCNF